MTIVPEFSFVDADLNEVDMKSAKYIRFPCQSRHRFSDDTRCLIPVNGNATTKGAKWALSGTKDKPTLTPSIRCLCGSEMKKTRCHFFLRNGLFQHCNDHPGKKKK